MLRNLIRHKDFLAVTIFFLLALSFFLRDFLQNQIIWGYDTPKIIFPLIFLLDESLKSFKLPLWTPDIYFGFPIGAEGQIAWFYPFNVLHIFLPLQMTISILSFVHVFLAGVFTYFFARIINLSRFASIFAGIAFMFNGFIIARMQYFSHIYAYAYLPLILLFIELALLKKNNLYFVFAGVALGFQFLSGHPNIPMMSLIYVFFYSLSRLWYKKLRFTKAVLILGLIAILIALPYLNLLLELIPLSIRANGVAGALYSSFSFFDFITFVFPDFFFTNTSNWITASTWHLWTYWGQIETTGYVGIITLFLIPFALIRSNLGKSGIFLVMLMLSFLLALGKNTPVYTILFSPPVLKGMTAPGRFLFLADFSLVILAAIGLNYICQNNIKKKLQWGLIYISIPIVLFLLINFSLSIIKTHPDEVYRFFLAKYSSLGYVQGIENRDIFLSQVISSLKVQTSDGLLLSLVASLLILVMLIGYKNKFVKFSALLLLSADLLLFASHVNVWSDPDKLFNKTDSNIVLLKQKLNSSFERIYTFSNVWSNLMPDQLILHHIQDGNGFASLPLQRFANWQMSAEEQWRNGYSKLFQLGSIKYVYDPGATSPLSVISSSLPRAYVTNSFIKASGPDSVLESLKKESFDLRTVIVEGSDLYSSNLDIVKFTPAEISAYHDNYVKILATTDFDGVLVLTDSFYPGWKAFVNGKETRIYQANYLFRAIFLPAGSNVIGFEYKPRFFSTTVMISIGTFLLILFLISKKFSLNSKILKP